MAGWAAALGVSVSIVVTVLAWALDPRSGAAGSQAVRIALNGWLLAQHVQLAVAGGALSLPPLAVSAGIALLLVRAGRVLARTTGAAGGRAIGRVAAALAAPYALIALVVALAAQSSAIRAVSWQAFAWPGLLAAAAAAFGAARESGWATLIPAATPRWVRATVSCGALAAAALLVAGLTLTLGVLAEHRGAALRIAEGMHPGASGMALLVALDVALLPNAAVAAASYTTGAGFAVGTATRVSPFVVRLHALPALPLLAALPSRAGPLGPVSLALPAAAGILAALALRRRWPRPLTLEVVAMAFGAGLVAGVLLTAAAVIGGGGAPGPFGALGASPWQFGLAAAAETGLAAAAATAAGALRKQLATGEHLEQ